MTLAEKTEMALVALATALTAVLSARLPHRLELGEVLLDGAAFLLVQGLFRDLARLRRARREPSAGPPKQITCACVESTVGLGAIAAGAFLVFAWSPVVFHPRPFVWPLGVAAVGAFGFVVRDAVIDWKERRVRRERDHGGSLSLRG
jgi:hypothetical protein